ncbi:MAG TPA: RsmG family class I SAM-dependent methyltransferase [Gracilimonas sp.]|uniref:16S rRNA (guanine(527)-N(7))-methyltransferase RsmG n=1 Tax=Gracilimonas sp. TaxID=1974203 RepID=UPI002DA27C1F|nr:RsmG family class I SAM-dependent methyltransferase [Gracilimonas sp.]
MFHVEHKVSYSEYTGDNVGSVRNIFQANKDLLGQYVDRLLWWNDKVNLVSRDVPRETVLNHIEHSLVISRSKLFKDSSLIIDAGTGGGLPGIPLAITNPDKGVVLNDIVSKKIMACKHMASGLKLKNTESFMGSLENLEVKPDSTIVSKHAFKINEMIKMIEGKSWLGVVLLKGRDEIESELSGIELSLEISVYDLQENFQNPFYNGKAMVEIIRRVQGE